MELHPTQSETVLSHVFGLRHHTKVFVRVVLLVAVNVVNDLALTKGAPQHFLGDYAVLMPAVLFDVPDRSAAALDVASMLR